MSRYFSYPATFMIFLATFLTGLFITTPGECLQTRYVFFSDWKYRILDPSYKIVKEGDLRAEIVSEGKKQQIKSIFEKSSIYKVYADADANRLFLLLGEGQASKFVGFVILEVDSLRFVQFLEKKMTMEFPVEFISHAKRNKFFVTYFAQPEGRDPYPVTEIYDLKSIQLIKKFSDTSFYLNDSACFVGDKLFNGRLFDIDAGTEIQSDSLPLGMTIYDCQAGYVLAASSKTIDEPLRLVIVNLNANPATVKEIKPGEIIAGFSSRDEWYLSKDAKKIIRDEKRKEGKSGTLVFFDIDTGKKNKIKINRKSPYGQGVLGFSLSGELLFYNSQGKLYIVNIYEQQILQEMQMPSNVVGVVWP